MARPWRPRYARPRPPRRARASIAHAHTWQNCRLGCRFVQTPSQQGGGSRMGGRRLRHARHSSPTSPALDASPDSACPRPTTNAAVLRPIHRLRPLPHARLRCCHMPHTERGTQTGELLLPRTRSGPATGTCSEVDDGDDASEADDVAARQVQQQGRQRAEAPAERSVEIAQAMVPLAGALARGRGGG